jgi:hypothetical protein
MLQIGLMEDGGVLNSCLNVRKEMMQEVGGTDIGQLPVAQSWRLPTRSFRQTDVH